MSRGLIAGAAAFYILAAWMVAPGFYDGFSLPSPYPFVCAPANAGAHGSPTSGQAVIGLSNGLSDPATAYTDDGAAVIGFLAASFDVTGKTSVTVDIAPVKPCPSAAGLRFVTNTYLVTADAPLVKPASLVMMYSNLEPDPSYVYRAQSLDGPWTNIGAGSQARLWTINARTDQLGYFAAGFPANSVSPGGSIPWLPIIVATLIAVVLLAGLPAAVRRRRP